MGEERAEPGGHTVTESTMDLEPPQYHGHLVEKPSNLQKKSLIAEEKTVVSTAEFNPECSLSKSDPYYKGSPDANDKVHVLVCVFDASSEHLLRNDVMETIQDIRDDATDLGIPQVAIFTKIDEACSKTKKQVRNVCRSKLIYERVRDFSRQTGIPENCIFPVKNYTMEKNLNNGVDALILNALKRIIEQNSLKND
ncbi:hypothetical protein CRENBAI_012748 [Crenichthys baileyi]|uniref:Interferon-induced protein 44-like n=1 Tax=Crenichthys baileyi TaxID=28760 RepID=A0AAV9S026_9TELE